MKKTQKIIIIYLTRLFDGVMLSGMIRGIVILLSSINGCTPLPSTDHSTAVFLRPIIRPVMIKKAFPRGVRSQKSAITVLSDNNPYNGSVLKVRRVGWSNMHITRLG